MQDLAAGREARAVAGAVPAALCRVPVDLAAEVRAACRDRHEAAVVVAVAGDLLALDADDVALAGSQVLDRSGAAMLEAFPDEVEADLGVLLEKGRTGTSGGSRLGSNSDAHGCARSRTRSERMRAAAVPLVIPHLAKPVAMKTRLERGVRAPM
jgi:hypothetical protein